MLGHIPDSVPLHWRQLTDNPRNLRNGKMTDNLDRAQSVLRAAGVHQHRPVLIVDRGLSGFGEAGRLFWTLDYFSHSATYILDGGIRSWPGPMKRALRVPAVTPGDLVATPRADRRALLAEVEAATHSSDVVVWDTRTPEEFLGATPYLESRGGHIPGAVSLEYTNFFGVDGRVKPPEAIDAVLERMGAGRGKRIIFVCSGGIRSAAAYAAAKSAGRRDIANYDGSMWEWASQQGLPIDTGPDKPLPEQHDEPPA
jgi:thiosulfate/3-mercaptopyruvate sulfurtransferase